jgi:hypothetical protein
MQAVELCRLLAELDGVKDAVPSSRLQSAASSPSIQVHRPRYRCMRDEWTDRVHRLVGEGFRGSCSRVAMQLRAALAAAVVSQMPPVKKLALLSSCKQAARHNGPWIQESRST